MEHQQLKSNPGDKFDGDKPRYDLIPPMPILELAQLYGLGAKKYTDWNWAKGLAYSRLYGALNRHLNQWWMGQKYDEETHIHHLIAVIWNAIALYEMERRLPEMDDRPWSINNHEENS